MKNQRGAVIIFVTICIVVLLGIAALAVDLGYMYVTRNELQNISDSASLAATRYIGHVYENLPPAEQGTHDFTPEIGNIKDAAMQMGLANVAATTPITLNDYDIQIGRWHFETKTFEPITGTLVRPTAVQVVARRDDSSVEGHVHTFFANIFGRSFSNVNSIAVASLSSQRTVEPGNLIPVGISDAWYKNKEEFCDQPIKFYPSQASEGCAGWNVFYGTQVSEDDLTQCPGGKANTECLRDRILNRWLTDPTYRTPGASTGDTFEFTGGNLGDSVFEAFKALFDKMKAPDGTWEAEVVVYNLPDCSNPQGGLEILGFSTVVITGVWEPNNPLNPWTLTGHPPSWYIEAKVLCDRFETSRGGGGEYGTYGSIPNLVK